ncbi:hypothetical protein ECEC1737_2115, partial [Escherichia coli EC1737]
LSWFISDREIQ